MERYSNSTREVAQDGRRGALMLSISVKHPEAEDFIDAKMTEGKITGANVSVKLDDEFMRCAIEGKPYHQQFPIEGDNPMMQKIQMLQLYGRRLFIMLGRVPNLVCYFGTRFCAKASPTVMPIWASAQ